MKTKRILSALLVLTVTLALLPNVVFAGDDYNIINGTPENDVTKNHGYITIDKTTAAENDTVTVEAHPADGYQLKSLVATPVASTEYTVTFDLNGITGTAPEAQTITSGEKVTKPTDPTDMIHTFAGWYKTKDATTGALSDPWDFDTDTVTADMTLYAKWTRTLESIYANSDIPKATNNTAPDDAWENGDGGKAFIAHSTGNAVLYLYKQLEPSGAKQLSCRKTEYFTKIGDDYVLDYYLSSSFYGKYTLHMTDGKFTSVTYNGAGTDYEVLSGTYSPVSQCIAAGTMVTMGNGEQKPVEELEIGDVVRTVDHETGTVSYAPVCFLWESKNAANAFTLTFEDDIEVTVIEEHGFYDQKEQKYVFINAKNAEDYIGHYFYNADTNSWLALKSIEMSQGWVDAYAIATSKHLNHLSNGMLSMCDGSVKVFANIFEHDVPLKINAVQKEKDITDNGGLTPLETVLKYKGFNEADYNDYNLQYLNVMVGKGLITWEEFKALSDYCEVNNIYDSLPESELPKEEAPKMLLMSATALKNLLGSAPASTPQGGIEITENKDGTYQFTMPAYAVTVTAEFEEDPTYTHSFTYTANNGKITATCIAGCDKGYDTTPLTLTLTAPASLVYDGNGKAFTFADGEADAWTGAGLELPTITYYQKYSGQGWYTQLNEVPVNAGGDYKAEITVNKKAAQVKFTINKAKPYIKNVPEPTDITYGQTLNDSTLFGGYAQISSTDSTQIGGWFEWTNGDTKPAVSDSETTEYDVTFTPSSDYEANFTTVTCKVKLKVNRAKTAVEPTVATGLVYDGTEQNGYTNEGNFVTFAGTKVAKSAGDYSFTATPDANYAWSDGTADTKTYNWEIAQKTATVKAVDASVRTGSTAPEFKVEFTDLLDADKEAVTEGFNPIFAVMTTGDMPVEIPVEYALKTAGDYTIVITNAEELDAFANYSFIAYTGKFTVIKRSSSSPAGGSVSAEPISYTVSFETNGAGAINSASIEKNATVSEPSAPTKEGYRFIGWYTDKACTNKYDFSNKVTKSMTLYAGWDQITSDDNMKDMIMLTIGKTEALAWGEVKNNDVAPIIRNDRTMLPARFVAENLGATVSWDADERKVTITKEGTEILIYIDSDIAYVNGEEVKLDSPAFIENDRTYTPVRFIAESLGAAVEWIEENQQVVITK